MVVTYLSILVGGGTNPGVNVVDVTVWASNEGGTSVNDGLATTRAGHSLTIDSNTVTKKIRMQNMVKSARELKNNCHRHKMQMMHVFSLNGLNYVNKFKFYDYSC